MGNVFSYILWSLFQEAHLFLEHWYVNFSLRWWNGFLEILRSLERAFGVRISAHYLLQPLRQDYTIIGYFMGFAFRSVRIVSGVFFYAALLVLAFCGWAAIELIPPALVVFAFLPGLAPVRLP